MKEILILFCFVTLSAFSSQLDAEREFAQHIGECTAAIFEPFLAAAQERIVQGQFYPDLLPMGISGRPFSDLDDAVRAKEMLQAYGAKVEGRYIRNYARNNTNSWPKQLLLETPNNWKTLYPEHALIVFQELSAVDFRRAASSARVIDQLAEDAKTIAPGLAFHYAPLLNAIVAPVNRSGGALVREYGEGIELSFLWHHLQEGSEAKKILANAYRVRIETMLTQLSILRPQWNYIPMNEDNPLRLPGYICTNGGDEVLSIYPTQVMVKFDPFEMTYEF